MLASDNDSPAAPSTGRALLRRFRFEDLFVCDMGPFSKIPHTQTLVFDLQFVLSVRYFSAACIGAVVKATAITRAAGWGTLGKAFAYKRPPMLLATKCGLGH